MSIDIQDVIFGWYKKVGYLSTEQVNQLLTAMGLDVAAGMEAMKALRTSRKIRRHYQSEWFQVCLTKSERYREHLGEVLVGLDTQQAQNELIRCSQRFVDFAIGHSKRIRRTRYGADANVVLGTLEKAVIAYPDWLQPNSCPFAPEVDHPFAREVDHPFAVGVDHPFAREVDQAFAAKLTTHLQVVNGKSKES